MPERTPVYRLGANGCIYIYRYNDGSYQVFHQYPERKHHLGTYSSLEAAQQSVA